MKGSMYVGAVFLAVVILFLGAWFLFQARMSRSHSGTTSDQTSSDSETIRTSSPQVSSTDMRYPANEKMYVVPYREVSIAIPYSAFTVTDTMSLTIYNVTLAARKSASGITVTLQGKTLPGYDEAWSSWIAKHLPDGVIWDISSLR